jgi:hypothetical protein
MCDARDPLLKKVLARLRGLVLKLTEQFQKQVSEGRKTMNRLER